MNIDSLLKDLVKRIEMKEAEKYITSKKDSWLKYYLKNAWGAQVAIILFITLLAIVMRSSSSPHIEAMFIAVFASINVITIILLTIRWRDL